jgi:hypothetical protein
MSHLRIDTCDVLSNFANRYSFLLGSREHPPKAPTRHEIVDSKLKEETADRACCDTACAEEGLKRRPFLGLHPGFGVALSFSANRNSSAAMRTRSG